MTSNDIPSEAPPSYQAATGSSAATSSSRPQAGSSSNPNAVASSHLEVPGANKSGIPSAYRRSMEDENRPLPEGWVRTFDPNEHHQFFVDTTKDPPRSIWVHPYDDEEYLSTLSSEERERLEQDSFAQGRNTSKADITAAHTDDEDDDDHHHASSPYPSDLPPRGEGKGKDKDTRSFGRKFKDKVTGMTHEEREQERHKRAQRERQMYEQHMRIRHAMARAQQTGQPQFMGKDGDGRDIYMEPPMYQTPYGGYPGRGYGVDPYRDGIYTTPDARYIRPPNPYMRPRGYGYGGGFGLPLMMGGGLLGGMLIGDALF